MHRALFILALILLSACRPVAPDESRRLLDPAGAAAEIEYFIRYPNTSEPAPVIVFLHGHQGSWFTPGGEVYVEWGVLETYADRGYVAIAISLPGYGRSDGPADFAGPKTQRAVAAVLSQIRTDPRADSDRILIQGVSLGAVTAGLVAANDPEIDGLILVSGLYDLESFLRDPATPGAAAVKAAARRQTGGGSQALRSRSLLHRTAEIRAATLILNGGQDDRTDPDQARHLAQQLRKRGTAARVVIFEKHGHDIPVAKRQAEINTFLATHFPAASTPPP